LDCKQDGTNAADKYQSVYIEYRKLRLLLQTLGVFAMLSFTLADSMAANEEIQIYMDEINRPGEFGLEIHNNHVFSGNTVPDYPGAQTPAHVFRLTPEFSYGLTDNFELGVYLLSSKDSRNNLNIDGEKLRLKYISSKKPGQSFFSGANFEIGYVAQRLDQNPWKAELKGILGDRAGRWTFAVNPIIAWVVSGSSPAPPTLEVDTKLSYAFEQDFALGLESYNGLGQTDKLLGTAPQNLYVVVDGNIAGFDLNVGIGHGFTAMSDKWVAKAIINVPFGNK
jgi:hypothetical protein